MLLRLAVISYKWVQLYNNLKPISFCCFDGRMQKEVSVRQLCYKITFGTLSQKTTDIKLNNI